MRLSDAFVKPLAYTRLFLNAPDADEAAFRQRIEQQLSEARLAATDSGAERSDIENAMFAAVAWIDETVMCSEWEGADLWRRRPLQKTYFNTTKAGVEFFSRLETLRNEEVAVREVFFLCLSLGFKGRYSADGGRFLLDEIKARELKLLLGRDAALESDFVLFPEAYAQIVAAPAKKRWRLTRSTLLWGGIPLLVLTILYTVFAFVLSNQVNDFLRLVQ
ncbi:type VI secretion system protein ImpK [Andreprevotia lacus DSM 23236]|jgi:type VI secretion system protein ImpK|uniref:Type VI secretion system protein ImpK n=1 Tax=Andreprevotia lacus DSM 23236 TaxID=1121001 RepID=A0A1W1XG88_9NEIS|nr:DotU family type IV/VI secretion system protein [Andreprevotia lacus]SMC22812.1 type VI secretion system protein ImpK [Andreprevotia lacus DSM 23236]